MLKVRAVVSAVFFIALFLLPNLVLAKTFNVSNTAQLRQAFENAAVNGEDDVIILEAGTYKTTDDGLGTFKFSDTEVHNLTIKAKDGLTANDVILDGVNTHQVLNLTNTKPSTFALDRVTIKNGKSSDGGGAYSDSNIIVTNSTITGNRAQTGGGIRGDSVTVTNSTITGNTASSGGGIWGHIVTVTNSTITGNTGGGIWGNTVTVTNSTITGNTASSGGGISGDSVTVTNSTIADNRAEIKGGGIYGGLKVTVTNSTITGNTVSHTAGNGGGGIYGSTVTVTNSTITGNRAETYGGGIHVSLGSNTFINNIFYNNSSDIYFDGHSNVYNNYIDYTKLHNESSYTIIKKNNIQPSSGSLNFADSSFRLGAGSVAIDKGLDPRSATFKNLIKDANTLKIVTNALQADKAGNKRFIGSGIDLGPYEFEP